MLGQCSLDNAPLASRAQVLAVSSDCAAARQLAHLGILAGAVLVVRRAAPIGGPILVEVGGGAVAIGRQLAKLVLVRLLP